MLSPSRAQGELTSVFKDGASLISKYSMQKGGLVILYVHFIYLFVRLHVTLFSFVVPLFNFCFQYFSQR